MNLPNKRNYNYKSDEGDRNSRLNKLIFVVCILIVVILAIIFS